MVTTIDLSPEKNKKIILSEIIQTIDVIPLKISDQLLIGGISKIAVDENCFFILNEYDKLVYVFDKEGRFLNKIGARGNGPGEVQFSQCFAMDKLRKEVWLADNHLFLKKYDYNGNFREQERFSLFYKDFHIGSTGEKYFHASKMTNFKPNGDPGCWNLFVSDLSDQLVTYFRRSYVGILKKDILYYQPQTLLSICPFSFFLKVSKR
ncbi:MAG: 6-bladed beta-propeller [Candidatus Azobacteroides sp.]|nr:6-bladed beta-propeller [Candidatus Azobacteroides sp.]